MNHLLAQTNFVGIVTSDPNFQPLINLKPSFYIITALNILLGAAGVASFMFLLWGGIQWIMAGGDKDAIDKARKKISNALIGLIIVFSAYAIFFVIRTWFNINLIQFNVAPLTSASSTGGGGVGGGGGGGGGGTVPGPGQCPCNSGCASTGAFALGDDNLCHTCQVSGAWTNPGVAGSCPAITCGACTGP